MVHGARFPFGAKERYVTDDCRGSGSRVLVYPAVGLVSCLFSVCCLVPTSENISVRCREVVACWFETFVFVSARSDVASRATHSLNLFIAPASVRYTSGVFGSALHPLDNKHWNFETSRGALN